MHRIVNTIGLGILGIDPMTAMYIMAMGLRKEKKSNISLFIFAFVGLSILQGVVFAVVFGTAAADVVKKLTPDDDSLFWVVLEIAVSGIILVWLVRKLTTDKNQKNSEKKQIINGSPLKYIGMGILFAISCFTDPTYYGVILLGGETRNFLYSLLLISLWLLVSQFMTFIVYAANALNLLCRLSDMVESLHKKYNQKFKVVLCCVLGIIALCLLADSFVYLFTGNYLF